jgi:hypothetical protein
MFRTWRRRRRLPWYYAQPPHPLRWCARCKRFSEPHMHIDIKANTGPLRAALEKCSRDLQERFGAEVRRIARLTGRWPRRHYLNAWYVRRDR